MTHHRLFNLILIVALVTACSPQDGSIEVAASEKTTESSGSDAYIPVGRLPETVRPTAYTLDLTVDPRLDEFAGTVTIELELVADTNVIWLHGNGLMVTSAVAQSSAGDNIAGTYQQVHATGVARIDLEDTLPPGKAGLTLEYHAAFDRNLAGLFRVEEQGDAYALAKSESIQARRFLPGFDEPGLKAPFRISLTVPDGYQAISNGAEQTRTPANNGMERVTFETTPAMSTYLLSLAVGPFDVVEREAIPANEFRSIPIPLRGFARRGRGDAMKLVLDVTAPMLAIFERSLKRPYPFSKLDIVAAPQWPSGATELSAAITYREQLLLVGDNPSPGARLRLLGVHAHELAHMWFGNEVTPPWWDDLWLKEGFATWGTPVALTELEPDGGHDVNAAVRAISAMELDSLANTRAIREPITHNDNVRNAYDSITYSKSLGVIHMVDQYFGPDVFRPALGRYLAAFVDSAADSDDFYRVIGEETQTPELTATFQSFVEQKGVPLITVDVACDSSGPTASLSQQRYRPLGSPIVESGVTWSIPVCLRSPKHRQCLMLTAAATEIALDTQSCPAWILPNAAGSGYYRWMLDRPAWDSLLASFAELSPTEQLSVVDSAFAGLEAGQIGSDIVLEVVRRSSMAPDRQVVTAPLARLSSYLRHTGENPAARAFLSELYRLRLDSLSGVDDAETRLLASRLLEFLATTTMEASARAELVDRALRFTGFNAPPDNAPPDPAALDSDLFEPALSVAVADRGEAFVRHLMAMRHDIDDPRFESASANALGHALDPILAGELMDWALGEDLGPREVYGLIENALGVQPLRDQHTSWLEANFAAIASRIPAQWRRRTPGLFAGFCDQRALDTLAALFEAHRDIAPGYERAMDQTREKIGLCMAQRSVRASLASIVSESGTD